MPIKLISFPTFRSASEVEKAILPQKLKMYEYKPKNEQPPRLLYMKNVDLAQGACRRETTT